MFSGSNPGTGAPMQWPMMTPEQELHDAFLRRFQPKTNNSLVDATLAVVLFSIVGPATRLAKELPSKATRYLVRRGAALCRRLRPCLTQQVVHVPYVNREATSSMSRVSESFQAVMHYLTQHRVINKGSVRLHSYSDYNGRTAIMTVPTDDEVYELQYKGLQVSVKYSEPRPQDEGGLYLGAIDTSTDGLTAFIRDCRSAYATKDVSTAWVQMVYTHGSNRTLGWNNAVASYNELTLDRVALSRHAEEHLLKDLRLFFSSEAWYKSRGISWTRGYLLYGPPGTGKTSIIKAVSYEYKMHIFYMNLREVQDDTHLRNLFGSLPTRCVLVLEDVDCASDVVLKREALADAPPAAEGAGNTHGPSLIKCKTCTTAAPATTLPPEWAGDKKVSLSTLLNLLDGVTTNHGRVVIMTTNHPEKLDPALVRPGRCDLRIQLGYCCDHQLRKLHRGFFEREPTEAEAAAYDKMQAKLTPALVTSVFLRHRDNPETALKELKCHFDAADAPEAALHPPAAAAP